jgi:MSHA biogenesis protein MshL
MKYVKYKGIAIILITCLMLISGCKNSFKVDPGHPAINDIKKAINEGIAQNKKIRALKKNKLPYSVGQALFPSIPELRKGHSKASEEARFDISVKNEKAKNFFLGLVKGTKRNLIVSSRIRGKISLSLKNVTLEEVLEATRDAYGYQFTKTKYGYRVSSAGLRMHLFKVNYLNLIRHGTSKTIVSSGQFSANGSAHGNSGATNSAGSMNKNKKSKDLSSQVNTESRDDFWGILKSTIQIIVPKAGGRKVIINPEAGILMVKAYPSEIIIVGNYLQKLEESMSREVIIEAKILEVTLRDGYEAGIDWSIFGGSSRVGVTQKGTEAVGPLLGEITRNIFTLNFNRFSNVIKLLETQGNIQTLSSPHIATLNNQKALIKVGLDQYFITDVSNTTQGTAGTTSDTQNIQLTPFFSGIALDVTPQINDNGTVLLHIHPVISKVTDQEREFKVSGKEQRLPLAKSQIREADSMVSARNGEIIVIGGLMENLTGQESGATPFLGKIPFIGGLFRRLQQSSEKTELVILLKPIVVYHGAWNKKLRNLKKRITHLNRGFYYGPHEKIFGNLAEHQ